MKKRLLSLCLAVVMVLAMLPVTALAATELTVSPGTVDIVDASVGPYTVKSLAVYEQGTFKNLSVKSAEQDGNTINVVLADDTDPSTAVQVGFSGTGSGLTLNHTGNTGTLSDGELTLTVGVTPFGGGKPQGPTVTYTINFTVGGDTTPAVKFTDDLDTTEVTYTQGKVAETLSVKAEYTEDTSATINYQWYSYTESIENAAAISEATDASYTPVTDTIGTTYYYVIATAGELTATSKTATITVVEPAVQFISDLSTVEVTYTQGKPASALTVAAEYTGVTDGAVTYRWYSYTDSADNAAAIEGAASASYTPASDTLGTTYYYVVASCEGLTATSKTATITVVEPVVQFIANLSTAEVTYTHGKTASALTVAAEYTGVTESTVTYQWYSNTTSSTEGGTAIEGETGASYTPLTQTVGTTYYYVVASCEGLDAASAAAQITVVEPVVQFNTNLSTTEVTVYQGKTASALTVAAEYTGVTESTVTYQWYSTTTGSTEDGTAINGETGASYTPASDTLGTTYYYVVASCEGLTATSNIAKVTIAEEPTLNVTDNVIDITDKMVYSWSRYYAKATNIKIIGADVEKATEDGTTVNIVLSGTTNPSQEISVEFGTSLNGCTMSGHTGTATLNEGKAQLSMTLTGTYVSYLKGSATYTLNFSLGAPPTEVPTRLVETDTKTTYTGVALELDLKDYFSMASTYHLVEDGNLTELNGSSYTFKTFEGGEHTLVFAASNAAGTCADYVTVTVDVTEIKSGAWLGVETSNGSVNYVLFKDADGNEIEGLTASLEGNAINVSVPRSFETGGTITAKFDLTQTDGLPFVSASTAFNQGKGTTTSYTSTISSASVTKNIYLYNAVPKATANNYTTYTINYAIANEAPVLAEGREAAGTASITADQTYTLDLDGIFTDPDADDTITGWKVSVNGAAAVKAEVDENNVYSYQTNDAGDYTLAFTALDNYNAVSTATYTVTLAVSNAATTYDVAVNVPDGIDPTFYYTEDAQEGTALTASEDSDNVYTVKVPTNVSTISWRADGVGMSAAVSTENNSLTLVKPVFKIMAEETEDTGATVTVTHANNLVGSENNYLLLAGIGGYTITATPSEDYISGWNEGKLTNHTVTADVIEIPLVSKDITITVPYFAELFVGVASERQSLRPAEIQPTKSTGPDYASGTSTYFYKLTNGAVYEYRVSVPADNVSRDQYVTYVGTFKKTDGFSLTITKEQLEAGDNGRATIDHDLTVDGSTLDSANVADLYLNINAQGYLKLAAGGSYQLKPARQWFAANGTWFIVGGPNGAKYYYVEPDFHYTVVGLDGQTSSDVITVDETGKITAVGDGTAIVLVTYDAMNLNHASDLKFDSLYHDPNGFYGAIWPENTGVFVVSVGAEDSGITTGMTINEDKRTANKTAGTALDAELDVIYFIGDKGKYTFTPGTEGVTVSVANPTVSETSMSFTCFVPVEANDDGSYSLPLTEGRNIVKLEKDGKAEYQIITAKAVSVTVNGEPLESASVAPGAEVSIVFDELYNPVNRACIYNTDAAAVYHSVSGWDGNMAGTARGEFGNYYFASSSYKRTVANFVSEGSGSDSYGNSKVTLGAVLTVPADYEGEYFTLSNGAFNVGGFSSYKLGDHRTAFGTEPGGGSSNNIYSYFGQLPDISIPVATPTSITVTTPPTKTEYNIGDVFDPAGMVVTASYGNSGVTRPVTGYTYDTTAFTEAGEKAVTITYGQLTTTVTVKVSDIRLEKIEATTAPSKTLYYIGDRFDPTGMVITATYSDNSTREITDYTYVPDVIAKDTTAITVTYGSKSVDVPVTVSLVERLEITAQPTKKNYTEGERFDPSGMVVKAYYTDGSSFETDKYDWSPAGQLSPSDTTITITYNGNEDAASLQPVTVNITVEALQSGDGDGDSGNTPPSYESITVYMTFVNRGSIVVQDTPVVVYDEDRDGTYRIGDAFRALHRDYYSGGESGYAEISGNGVSGWVSKFWGSGDSTFTYARNHRWASSTNNSIYSGDSIAAINGVDSDFFSDLYTWFDSSSYSALTEQNETFTVNGLNLMGSSASYNALHAPAGATVSVYKSGSEISSMRTTVGADGSFTLYFTEAGTYTLKISGTAEWGSYTDAPVAPCTCTVYVRKNPTPEEKPEEKPNETPADTVTPEIEADANGEAKVEIGTDAVADALEQAVSEGKDSVVVTPAVKGGPSIVTVELPKDAVDNITENSDMNLKVETPAASVTISNAGLAELTGQKDGSMSVSVETVKDENGDSTGEIRINVAVDNESVANVSGGIAITVPVEEVSPGSVLVVVHSDGTETVVKKSAAGENGVAALLDGSATVKIVDNSKEFVDVDSESWYADGVDFVSSRELYKGIGNDRFDPTGDMTRGMLVTVLHRLEDEMEHNYGGSFHDVKEDNWYTDAIHWAADHGLVNGYGNGYFGTNDEMTREQMITMTFRYLKWLGVDTSARGDLNTFTDSKEISDWAKEAMEWGVGAGIIEGTGNSLVDPEGNATRAQVAVFMQRVIGLMVK